MKSLFKYLIPALFVPLIFACGGENSSQQEQAQTQTEPKVEVPKDPYENWKEYQGVGPIEEFQLPADVDQSLASSGKAIFESKCSACHKVEKKFIGPSPKDILSRRNPAWVMNMILAPERMVQEDPIAKKLLMDHNGSPMANQNLTEDEARSVLEYFRTL